MAKATHTAVATVLGGVDAAQRGVAGIVRARVIVIAVDRLNDALVKRGCVGLEVVAHVIGWTLARGNRCRQKRSARVKRAH